MVAVGCGGAYVDVRNHSTVPLRNVVVAAQGGSAAIGDVEPSSSQVTSLCPHGEAGALEVTFESNGLNHRSKQPLYFECSASYGIEIVVSREFEVVASVRIK